jgi:hypothetical protein
VEHTAREFGVHIVARSEFGIGGGYVTDVLESTCIHFVLVRDGAIAVEWVMSSKSMKSCLFYLCAAGIFIASNRHQAI